MPMGGPDSYMCCSGISNRIYTGLCIVAVLIRKVGSALCRERKFIRINKFLLLEPK